MSDRYPNYRGSTTKPCSCSAHNADECSCGAWDDLNPFRLRERLEASEAARERAEKALRDIDAECRRFDGIPPMQSRWKRIKDLAAGVCLAGEGV